MSVKTKVLALLTLVSTSSTIFGQGPFEIIYPSTRDRAMRDVIRTSSGNYMLCGWTNTSDPTESDVIVMQTDINGNELPGWPKIYGKTGAAKVDFAYSLIETTDNNFFILGWSSSYGGGDADILLLKIAADGSEVMPPKTFGGFGFDEGRRIIKTKDNNYMIVGTSTNGNNQDAFLMKIDVAGNPLWSPAMRYFGTTSKEFGNALAECPDGGFIIAGQTLVGDARGDTYIVKSDANGTMQWGNAYPQPLADEGVGVVVNSDGSSVVAIRDSVAGRDIDVRIRKFDAQGNADANYNKVYGGNLKDTPKGLTLAKDGNFYVPSISRSVNWRNEQNPANPDDWAPDMWLLKLDAASGDLIWSRNFGRADHDHCEQAIADPVQDAILLCGHSVGQPYVKKPYFLKLNTDGLIAPLAVGENVLETSTSLYPNPTAGSLELSVSSEFPGSTLTVSNYLGQVVHAENNITLSPAETKKINLNGQKPGIYILTIENKNSSFNKKIILQ